VRPAVLRTVHRRENGPICGKGFSLALTMLGAHLQAKNDEGIPQQWFLDEIIGTVDQTQESLAAHQQKLLVVTGPNVKPPIIEIDEDISIVEEKLVGGKPGGEPLVKTPVMTDPAKPAAISGDSSATSPVQVNPVVVAAVTVPTKVVKLTVPGVVGVGPGKASVTATRMAKKLLLRQQAAAVKPCNKAPTPPVETIPNQRKPKGTRGKWWWWWWWLW
jgi:hypothetical protein